MYDPFDIINLPRRLSVSEANCVLRRKVHDFKLYPSFGDAIIIGASSSKHLEENLADIERGLGTSKGSLESIN